MGLRVLHDVSEQQAVLFDSVTDWAFGPLFDQERHADAYDAAECFLSWLSVDPRHIDSGELGERHAAWVQARDSADPDGLCGVCFPSPEPDDMSGATRELNGHR